MHTVICGVCVSRQRGSTSAVKKGGTTTRRPFRMAGLFASEYTTERLRREVRGEQSEPERKCMM